MQVLGPMAFRRRDVLLRLWRVTTHQLRNLPAGTAGAAAARFVVQKVLFPATCLVSISTAEWAAAWAALSRFRQVERCRLYYETAAWFGLEPRDRSASAPAAGDMAARLARHHCEAVRKEVSLLEKKAYMPKVLDDATRQVRLLLRCRLLPAFMPKVLDDAPRQVRPFHVVQRRDMITKHQFAHHLIRAC